MTKEDHLVSKEKRNCLFLCCGAVRRKAGGGVGQQNGNISKHGKADICNSNLNICKKGSFFATQTLLKASCLIAMVFSGYRWDIVIDLIRSHVKSLTYLSSKL